MFWKAEQKVITDTKRINDVLTRATVDILPSREALQKLLESGRQITLYQGFDPTGADLHIGSMVGLRKLAQFQKLGHKVIFLIGDGTGQAGDPSGKTRAREKFFTQAELRENAKNYIRQVKPILEFSGRNKAEVRFNGDWLNRLTLSEILDIAGNLTLQQLSERDIFQERIRRGEPVNLREFLYPLLQGYDSVALSVDLEIGGQDQLFNMLVGRTLARRYLNKEKHVLTTPLLTDATGAKIGKSEGNVIGLTDEPADMYGKIMSLGDDVITRALEYLTDVPMTEISHIEKQIESGENPLQFKKRLAREVVGQLHGMKQAREAERAFVTTFSQGNAPASVVEISVPHGSPLVDVLVEARSISSRSEFRRLITQGGIHDLDSGDTITDESLSVEKPLTLKIGKRRFLKIVPKN